MYNTLREKVNLLLEDSEFKVCPSCHEMIDNCNCETTQEASSPSNYGTSEGYSKLAKQILKYQKKLGKLKSVKVQVLSLDESRKKRLKSAGIFVGATVAGAALLSGLTYATFNHHLNKKYRNKMSYDRFDDVKKFTRNQILKSAGAGAASSLALTGAGTAITKDLLQVVAICDYQYGKKIIALLSVDKDEDTKKVSQEINKNIKSALKTAEKSQEWSVKEDVSDVQFMTAQLEDLLIENVLNY